MKYIDIHSHLIFGVDDGSKTFDQSKQYLKEMKKIGLNKVVCTPHIRSGNKDKVLKIIENFKKLREEANNQGIELYIGNEILYSDKTLELLKNKRITTINHSKYILLEFKRSENMHIDSVVNILESFIDEGYKVVLAHPELYPHYRNINDIKKIKETGALLQMDATSILRNKTNRHVYKFSKKLLTERLIDVIASDAHCTKKRNFLSLDKAYSKIKENMEKNMQVLFSMKIH